MVSVWCGCRLAHRFRELPTRSLFEHLRALKLMLERSVAVFQDLHLAVDKDAVETRRFAGLLCRITVPENLLQLVPAGGS